MTVTYQEDGLSVTIMDVTLILANDTNFIVVCDDDREMCIPKQSVLRIEP